MARDVDSAVAEADIICTATTSTTPVFDGRLIKPGTHINGVGSFTPEMQEVDLVTVQRSLVVVDSRTQCLSLGEAHHAVAAGLLSADEIHAELGEVVLGERLGREADELIVCDLTGVGAQDAAMAGVVWKLLEGP